MLNRIEVELSVKSESCTLTTCPIKQILSKISLKDQRTAQISLGEFKTLCKQEGLLNRTNFYSGVNAGLLPKEVEDSVVFTADCMNDISPGSTDLNCGSIIAQTTDNISVAKQIYQTLVKSRWQLYNE